MSDNEFSIQDIIRFFNLQDIPLKQITIDDVNKALLEHLDTYKDSYLKNKKKLDSLYSFRNTLIEYIEDYEDDEDPYNNYPTSDTTTIKNAMSDMNEYKNDEQSNKTEQQKDNENLQAIEQPYTSKNSLKTFQNEYNSSKLNPIQRDVFSFQINIDSYFRNNPFETNSNNFIFKLNKPLKNIIQYEVKTAELPNKWYSISSLKQNNQFTILVENYKDTTGTKELTTTTTIIIPDGNYSTIEIKNIINNYFNNFKNGLEFLYFDINLNTNRSILRVKSIYDGALQPKPYDTSDPRYSPNFKYTVYFDISDEIQLFQEKLTVSQKYPELVSYYNDDFYINNYTINQIDTITCINGDDLVILDQKTRPLNRNFGYILGFEKHFYEVVETNTSNIDYSTDISDSVQYKGYLESENFYGNTIESYVFLSIDDFNKNSKNGLVVSSIGNNNDMNIISKLPILNTNTNDTNNIQNNHQIYNSNGTTHLGIRTFFGPVDIDKFQIKLIDKYGELIDLNKNDFSLTLEVKQIYS